MIYKEVLKGTLSLRTIPRIASNLYHSYRSLPTTGLPFKLQFENTNICNLKCTMCPQMDMKRPQGRLTFEKFKYVYDQIKPPYLNLTGIGEPFLNADIYKIVEYARKNKTFVKMDTNATLLDNDRIEKILKADPNIISVSIDGMTKETFEAIRQGAKFETVINNLKELVVARNKRKSKTQIHMFMVVQENNLEQLPDFVKFGLEIGIDSISGTHVKDIGYQEITWKGIEKAKEERIRNLYNNLKQLNKDKKVKLDSFIHYLEELLEGKENPGIEAPCFWPWYSVFLNWDGDITPCCFSSEKQVVFGNAFKEPFMKIWNNEKAQKFRKALTTKREGICGTCGNEEFYVYDKFKLISKIPFMKKLSVRNYM